MAKVYAHMCTHTHTHMPGGIIYMYVYTRMCLEALHTRYRMPGSIMYMTPIQYIYI